MLNVEPYYKTKQWHDSKQLLDEFIRFFTRKTHVSMVPLFQFKAPMFFPLVIRPLTLNFLWLCEANNQKWHLEILILEICVLP